SILSVTKASDIPRNSNSPAISQQTRPHITISEQNYISSPSPSVLLSDTESDLLAQLDLQHKLLLIF
ncbi:4175_t:CDS:1, partial [Racocetra persica]